MKKYLPSVIIAIIGVVFCVSAVLKLVSIESFELYVFGLGIVSMDLSAIFVRLVISAELILGLAYIFGVRYRFFRWAGVCMLGAFTLFLIPVSFLYPDSNCHCFGEGVDIKPLPSIIKNILMLLPILLIRSVRTPLAKVKTVWIVAAAFVVTVAVFAVSPPDGLLKGRRQVEFDEGAFWEYMDTKAADAVFPEDGTGLMCFYSTGCRYCKLASRKISAILDRHGIPRSCISIVFMDTGQGGEERIALFLDETGAGGVDYAVLDPVSFLSITRNKMPLMVMLSRGDITGVYDFVGLSEKIVDKFIGDAENRAE